MKILLINPPHTAIGSRIPRESLPPLGLLALGGPLIDIGHQVQLLDADRLFLSVEQILAQVSPQTTDLVMIGHSGSSSVHRTVLKICESIKSQYPHILIVYGGVYPTYHWDEIFKECGKIDIIVRGEGEKTVCELVEAIESKKSLAEVAGIVFRQDEKAYATPNASVISDLDQYRIGWELISHRDYSYWGGKRAVVVQFSRGCPFLCSYCGQRGFWTKWRHRDPVKFAKELARLYREEGVELINFADELPSGSRKAWQSFLEALIAENVSLLLVGSTRTSDIVRDKDILHLYKKAGFVRFLLGIETYNEETMSRICKGGTVSQDREAIQLLRKHGIISMATYVVGFQEEGDIDYWHSYRHLLSYDPDQVQLLYATPHKWTPFYKTVEDRRVIQLDQNKWDYKHQVLEAKRVPAWRVFAWFKLIELLMQARPKVVWRMLFHPDFEYRYAMRWYTQIGRRVWFHEWVEFLFRTKIEQAGPLLAEFMGENFDEREYSMEVRRKLNSTASMT
jgi:anaerobic magnesium-protoporphyrin IX monomethyl ester cyclase